MGLAESLLVEPGPIRSRAAATSPQPSSIGVHARTGASCILRRLGCGSAAGTSPLRMANSLHAEADIQFSAYQLAEAAPVALRRGRAPGGQRGASAAAPAASGCV